MIEIKESISSDADLVWVIYLYLNGSTYKLSTKDTALNYFADTIEFNSISGFATEIDILSNHIGTIGQLSFAISRINELGLGNDFQNYFYPYSAIKLLNSFVDFGFCTTSTTDESKINWLGRFVVSNYSYRDNAIDINCLEYIGLEFAEIPNEVTQNQDESNPSTYVRYKEHEGQVIPITYGRFKGLPEGATKTSKIILNLYDLAPCLMRNVDEVEYLLGNHKISSFSELYMIDGQSGYFLRIYNSEGTEELRNFSGYSSIALLPQLNALIYFDVYTPLTSAGDSHFAPAEKRNEIYKIGNESLVDYVDLDATDSVGDAIYITTQGQLNERLTISGKEFTGRKGKLIIGYETLESNVEVDVYSYANNTDGLGYSTYFTVPVAGVDEIEIELEDLNNDPLNKYYDWPYATGEKYYLGNKSGNAKLFRIYYIYQSFTEQIFAGLPISKKRINREWRR